MDLLQAIVLAILQGLTEFLPISSSAHLILAPKLLGWEDQQLTFDVAVHIGTLGAVLLYFRRELFPLARGWLGSLQTRQLSPDGRLAWAIILGTIPVGIAGIVFHESVETTLRTPIVIALATIGFGILLGISDVTSTRKRDEHTLGLKDIIVIGLAQALALIPGTSRSGITMTAGLMIGLTRSAAARFSFLLSIPTILAAGSLKTLELIKVPHTADWAALGVGVVLAAVTAYACIHFFLKLLERIGMWPFVIYRLILGGVLLILFPFSLNGT